MTAGKKFRVVFLNSSEGARRRISKVAIAAITQTRLPEVN